MNINRCLSNQRGLSLIEVILTIVILTVGIAGVLKPMLESVSALNYLENRFVGERIMKQKVWEIEDNVAYNKPHIDLHQEESLLVQNRPFEYKQAGKVLSEKPQELSEIRMSLSWLQGGIPKKIVREFYVLFPLPKKGQ